MHAAIENGL